VVAAIVEARPAFLAVTGDLVFDGSSAAAWAEFDALMAPVREARIPVFSAFGNHEYWGLGGGEAHVAARFPHLAGQHFYTVAFGPVRLVVLDSNAGELGLRRWREELRSYARTLAELDRDPAVRGVIVLLHHPPFTNSTVTGDEEHVQRDVVPAFLGARKTLALMSGHVHSYERFARAGKTFVVSGGGGGPRARLATGAARRHPDDLFAGPALRDFNFLLVTVRADGLAVEVRGLPKGGETWRTMDRFDLPFAE
jgi:3',5'-cyclic AMP phosphodiesterase CpdA